MKFQSSINKGIIEKIKTKITMILTLTLQSIKTHDTFYMVMMIGTITYQLQVQILVERFCFGSPPDLDWIGILILSYANVDSFQLDTIAVLINNKHLNSISFTISRKAL